MEGTLTIPGQRGFKAAAIVLLKRGDAHNAFMCKNLLEFELEGSRLPLLGLCCSKMPRRSSGLLGWATVRSGKRFQVGVLV